MGRILERVVLQLKRFLAPRVWTFSPTDTSRRLTKSGLINKRGWLGGLGSNPAPANQSVLRLRWSTIPWTVAARLLTC